MSWFALAGAAIGYIGTQQTNSANARAARNQGYVDMRSERMPDEYSRPYRQDALQAAYEALFGRGATPAGGPAAGRQILGDWQAAGGRVDRGRVGTDVPGHEDPGGPEFGPAAGLPTGAPQFTKEGDKGGIGTSAPERKRGPRTFGGWTAEEMKADPSREGKLGPSGKRKYLRYLKNLQESGDGDATFSFLMGQ